MKRLSIVTQTKPLPVKEIFKANPAYARHKRNTKEGKVRYEYKNKVSLSSQLKILYLNLVVAQLK